MSFQTYKTNIDGLELVIDTQDGSVYASPSALAQLCNTSEYSIMRWSEGSTDKTLYPEAKIEEALWIYNPDLYGKCVQDGIRANLYNMMSYKPGVTRIVNSVQDIKDLALLAKMFEKNGDSELAQLVKTTLSNQLLALNGPGLL